MTRRIIVAIDESPASYQALRASAHLAAELSAEIFALFIEDSDLFAIASVPGGSYVSLGVGNVSPFDEGVLARTLRVQARRLKAEVARIAGNYRVSWQFQVARGRVCEEILKQAQGGEMIAIGAASRLHRRGFGSNVPTILSEAHGSVLVFHERGAGASRIVVMSESPAAGEIGAAFARIAGALGVAAIAPQSSAAAFDQLMRASPSHVITDRAMLAKLGLSPQELVNALDLEALILVGLGNS